MGPATVASPASALEPSVCPLSSGRDATGPRVISCDRALKHASPLLRMAALALRVVTEVVPAQAAAFFFLDYRLAPNGAVVRLDEPWPRGRRVEDGYEEYARHFWRTDPLAPHLFADDPRTVVTRADVADPDAARRSAWWRQLDMRGVRFDARVLLRAAGRLSAGVSLVRDMGDPELSHHEVAFLRRAQPFFELAYAGGLARHRAMERAEEVQRDALTARELEVARLAAGGATNAEISAALNVRPATVKAHLTHAFTKLGVRSRTELAIRLHDELQTGAP